MLSLLGRATERTSGAMPETWLLNLLTETMRLRREMKLESYDRLFPSQDTLPQRGFGNLIALPFQFQPRKAGHSLFVDGRFEAYPWDQQWQYLADIERLSDDRVRVLAREAVRTGRVLAVSRIVVCAKDLPKHLALPRAYIDDARHLLEGEP